MAETYENILRKSTYSSGNPAESLCKLRWDQPTIDLFAGQVRVCCRVPSMTITEHDLQNKKTDAILNNDTLLERRREMFHGIKHIDCAPCWKAEASGQPSPRAGAEEITARMKNAGTEDFKSVHFEHPVLLANAPSFLEIQMGNLCDLKCVYCWRGNSSKWAQEDLQFGKITEQEFTSLNRKAPEAFAEIFWQWLESVAPHLEMISFVGGEPTLQTRFPEILMRAHEIFKKKGNTKIRIRMVSNLNCGEIVWSRLMNTLSVITSEGRQVLVDVSMEAFGHRAEFIRFGLDWQRFDRNLEHLLSAKLNGLQVAISATLNALSITSLGDFLEYLDEKQSRLGVMIPFLENSVIDPIWLAPEVLTPDFKSFFEKPIAKLRSREFNSLAWWGYGWHHYANYVEKIAGTIHFEANTPNPDIKWTRQRFAKGIQDLETRRGLNFSQIFPEMGEFYSQSALS